MSSSGLITKALNDPNILTDAERARIAELAKSYPYFVPAISAETVLKCKEGNSLASLANIRELYIANWLLFCEHLNPVPVATPVETSAHNEVAIETTPADTAITDTTDNKNEAQAQELPANEEIIEEEPMEENKAELVEEPLIQPVYTEDYFLHQGVQVPDEIPEELDKAKAGQDDDPKSLMVMMSFSEWLQFFKARKQKETEEEQEKKALRTMWQKEKLAAALEEEGDEIPEEVFKMAVDSITKEEGLVSESLAEIHYKQGKYDKAIDMYRKLSLRNPGKKVYFARKIEEILKNK